MKNPRGSIKPLNSFGIVRYSLMLTFVSLFAMSGVGYMVATSAASAKGSIEFTVRAKDGTPLENVMIRLAGAGGFNCADMSRLTGPRGHATFSRCTPGVNRYTIASYEKGGYIVSDNTPHPPGDKLSVWAGINNEVSLIMRTPPPAAPAPNSGGTAAPSGGSASPGGNGNGGTPAPSGSGAATRGSGKIVFRVRDEAGSGVSGVRIRLAAPGGFSCGGSSSPVDVTGPLGNSTFDCQTLAEAGALPNSPQYTIAELSVNGYSLSPKNPHLVGDTIRAWKGVTNEATVILRKNPAPASAPPAGAALAPAASTPAAPTAALAPVTSAQKKGTIQVTTYVYNLNGTISRIGSVRVHTKAVGISGDDTARNCSDPNKLTNSSGPGGVSYGQASFKDCWTGNGSQAYQLTSITVPAGYTYRSYRITGPAGAAFASGATSTNSGVEEQFIVSSGATVKLAIWLNKAEAGNPALSGVKQIVNQNGVKFKPGNNSVQAQKTAELLNTIFSNKGVNLASLSPEETFLDNQDYGLDSQDAKLLDEDMQPPSAPRNLKAEQDRSGSITLRWEAAVGDPANETVTYSVERAIKGSDNQADLLDFTESLSSLDDSDTLEYPQTYIYMVVAADDNGNESPPATVEITTVKPAANLGIQSLDDSTTTANQDSAATLAVDSNLDTALACDVSTSSSEGIDLLDSLGPVVGEVYTPVCRDDSGDIYNQFDENIDLSVEYDSIEAEGDATLYGFDGTDWQAISDSGQKSSLPYSTVTKTTKLGKTTYKITTKRPFAVALVSGKQKPPVPAPLPPLLTLMAFGAMIFLAQRMIRRRLEARYVVPYGDIDLLPHNFSNPHAGGSAGSTYV